MGGFSLSNGMPGISMPAAPSYGMGDALGSGLRLGTPGISPMEGLGSGITSSPSGGISYSPPTSLDLTKMADALKSFGTKPTPYAAQQPQQSPHNKQDDYQQYLNVFNAQNKG